MVICAVMGAVISVVISAAVIRLWSKILRRTRQTCCVEDASEFFSIPQALLNLRLSNDCLISNNVALSHPVVACS